EPASPRAREAGRLFATELSAMPAANPAGNDRNPFLAGNGEAGLNILIMRRAAWFARQSNDPPVNVYAPETQAGDCNETQGSHYRDFDFAGRRAGGLWRPDVVHGRQRVEYGFGDVRRHA